ncbi:uncharacterized protein LOC134216867 [Armigeres subalbatus]|uniref:uncharacterized protein LOC134216867 n=1 Tax=Armigeres subalbatus TaxID=124917 RepID=UPI002ED2B1BD
MIIMRALVATVLLITVVLVSIVLISANSRHVRDTETVSQNDDGKSAEVNELELEVTTNGSFEENERMGLNPEEERKAYEFEEPLVGVVKDSESSTLINAIRKAGSTDEDDNAETVDHVEEEQPESELEIEDGEEEEIIVLHKSHSIDPSEVYEGVNTEDVFVSAKQTESSEQVMEHSPATHVLTSGEEYYVRNPAVEDDTKKKVKEESQEQYHDPQSVAGMKVRPKENLWGSRKTSPVPERQTPLGYEPESYVVVNEETYSTTTKRVDDFSEADDMTSASSSISIRPLERRQRAAVGNPETIVLNRAPIVPHIEDEYPDRGCPHLFPPLLSPRFSKNVEHPVPPSYPGMASIYNPHNWDTQNMNLLRFPQCASCQRKRHALCRTCGRCSDCCLHSGCTCGCLHS